MREIKFKLLFEGEPQESEWTLEQLADWHDGGKLLRRRQFTDLHDKNGKEIYEGDILKRPCGCCDDPEFQNISIMEFKEGSFTLKNMNCHYKIKDFEIIGNIYENPELLEGNK